MLDLNAINILKKQGHIIRSDNTLHGFTKARIVQLVRCLENNWAAALERCENQYKILCGYHEKEKKYAWHDLRKNPDDLPDTPRLVLTKIDFEYWEYEISRYMQFEYTGMWMNQKAQPIAWREIEPFGGEKDV